MLFLNHNNDVLKLCLEQGASKERLVLFQYEPSVVLPTQYSEMVLDFYGTVFTFRYDLVDHGADPQKLDTGVLWG